MKSKHILNNISKQDIQRWYDLTFCIGFAALIIVEKTKKDYLKHMKSVAEMLKKIIENNTNCRSFFIKPIYSLFSYFL